MKRMLITGDGQQLRVDIEFHGIFTANQEHVDDTMSTTTKLALAKTIVEARSDAYTVTYWMGFPKLVLAIQKLDLCGF